MVDGFCEFNMQKNRKVVLFKFTPVSAFLKTSFTFLQYWVDLTTQFFFFASCSYTVKENFDCFRPHRYR